MHREHPAYWYNPPKTETHPMNLHLPPSPIPDRVSITGPLPPNQRTTHAEPDGPRYIQHIWVVLAQPERLPLASR